MSIPVVTCIHSCHTVQWLIVFRAPCGIRGSHFCHVSWCLPSCVCAVEAPNTTPEHQHRGTGSEKSERRGHGGALKPSKNLSIKVTRKVAPIFMLNRSPAKEGSAPTRSWFYNTSSQPLTVTTSFPGNPPYRYCAGKITSRAKRRLRNQSRSSKSVRNVCF